MVPYQIRIIKLRNTTRRQMKKLGWGEEEVDGLKILFLQKQIGIRVQGGY